MHQELGLLPSGRIVYFAKNETTEVDAEEKLTPQISKLVKLFSDQASVAEGLFSLAALKIDAGLPPTFRFWRSFACQYMVHRCHLPVSNELRRVGALDAETGNHFIANRPPMRGAEYLSLSVLSDLWTVLDEWILRETSENHVDFSAFLKKRAPHWHQVGRVCFHLAENKNDPNYPFAFMATYSPELSAQGQSRHKPLGKALEEYADSKNKKQLINLLLPVDLASKSSPLVKELVASGDLYHPIAWQPNEAYRFLKEVSLYEACGIVVRLPDWWKKRPRPRVSVTLGASKSNAFSSAALIEFDVGIVLGEQTLTEDEWGRLMAATDDLVFLKGQWIEVDKAKLDEALAHWQGLKKGRDGLSFIEGMRLLAGASPDLSVGEEEEEITPWSLVQSNQELSNILAQIRQPASIELVQPGKALHATLRPYQETGVKWLWYLHQLGLGACLADDMGLGKTIQIISLLLILKKEKVTKASLLVLPASLLENWKIELKRFAPSLKIQFLHPSQISKAAIERIQTSFQSEIATYDLVITTYSMLDRQSWLFEHAWQLVIADEAQALKNPGTRQAKAAKKLRAQSKIALTGTPVENRLSDLWSLFDFICPALLGTASRFKHFTTELEKRSHDTYAPLRNLVQPYILRRLKTDKTIISDLPDKTEVPVFCSLTKEQAALYERSVEELVTALQTLDGIKRRGIVLSYLLRFKQICNHPSQLIGDRDYTPKHSGKFTRLAAICEEISLRQEKTLVFTQFREMCEPIAHFLTACFGRPGLILHGGVSVKQRQRLVNQFQEEDGPPFFVISLKAGGTGLNLTAASHVIHFDRWWNPAVENQATDRAFRIGQKKNVLVHKFVCQGTVEEKIDALIAEKSMLASELLEGSKETLLTEMSDSELIALVTLDVDRAVV